MAGSKTKDAAPAARSDDVFDFAPGWMPNEGESLIGTVTDRGIGEGEFGEYIIITLRPDAGQTIHIRQERTQMEYTTDGTEEDVVAVHCFGAVLDSAMRKLRPPVGMRIAFRKLGKRLRKGGEESNPRDWFNAWQVRDLSVKSDDDLFGPTKPVSDFNDEPPF
jgi:hypothetical protein